ncbi:MAG: plasmid-related protein [Kangiella sp.]|nr:MAG: plasmid-related protein [Kangiella sp.]
MPKSSALRIRIEPVLHREFIDACQSQDLSASQVLRHYMRSYVEKYHLSQQAELFQEDEKHSKRQ